MKKLFALTLLLISGLVSNAQYRNNYGDKEESNFKLGLTIHPNIGWIRSDDNSVSSDGLRFGFSYGLMGDFLFQDNYAFSTGLKLTTINGLTETVGTTSTIKETYKLQYIDIPTKIKLLTNENNGIRFFGEFGLGNAFNVRAKKDVKSSISTENQTNVDIFKKTAFYRGSIIIGGGAEISTSGKTRLMAGLTFDNGFTDIKKSSGTLKSSYLGLNIGVFF